jgi:hypothetical protein
MPTNRSRNSGIGTAIVLVGLLMTGANQLRAGNVAQGPVVVIGSPTDVKFIASESGELPNGDLRLANAYSLVLERVRKIAGEGVVPSRLRLRLSASHQGSLSREKLISVVLELKDGKYEAKYWDAVRKITCVPRELMNDETPAKDVYVSTVGDEKCMKFE